ncbi:MerR family transcriptional regulator [Deinococcus yavapaiensis]|uniref:DNA-binding transcriptional MerR regulator n=1 Tax=Deinococcus yavapaiensis KR-236 TaxID=694435 RepID=A0A318S9W7_9DEIO|nr:MerR family transcriptional regulator [Deinococcus yavapaiensis]PYE55940.1 DNA-binding transcriptional MerR regulator [Deinococcus yavapaiensis KR-236]
MLRTVGEVARMARVSVRTLHHYDEIGLLSPSGRSEGNYRLYTREDVERLYQVLVYRDLGFPLDEIRRVMQSPEFDRLGALKRQRALLAERVGREQRMLATLDALITSTEGGTVMADERVGTLFDGFDPDEYEEEAKERWGDTKAYRQSQERVKRYTKADWARFKAQMQEVTDAYVALLDEGVPPESPKAAAVSERHRLLIDHWFYDCSLDMFDGLARMWTEDHRFTKNIDKARDGLAAYQSAAARAYVAANRAAAK